MAGCASCGGCCAHCASTCGVMGGASFGAMGSPLSGSLGGFGVLPFLSRCQSALDAGDNLSPADAEALFDLKHPGHRGAVTKISRNYSGAHAGSI